jgi:hypothetical protein
MKKLVVAAALLLVSGCDFVRGFRDEGARQATDIAVDLAADRVVRDLSTRVEDLRAAIPQKDPVSDGLLYSAGGLLAYILGSFGKGKIRDMRKRKEEA